MDPVYKQIHHLADEVTRLEGTMIDPREFGRLEGAVDNLKKEVDEIKAKQTLMDQKLDLVLDKLSEAKGGWRMMMLLGGAGATLGGIVTWFATHTLHIAPK